MPFDYKHTYARLFYVFIIGLICGAFTTYLYLMETSIPIHVNSRRVNNLIQMHSELHIGESTLADELSKRVRVFCFILTTPSNLNRALHVKATWASRCNGYLFISSETNDTLPSIAVVKKEGRDILWTKTASALLHIEKHFKDKFDFFLKTDDDTYVIVENLRKMLSTLNSDDAFIMGRRFKPYVKQGYMSGGGGYVLSRKAMLMVTEGLRGNPKCTNDDYKWAEDVKLGMCAEAVGVKVINSLDAEGKESFHPFHPSTMLQPDKSTFPDWFHQYNFHKIETGFNCCSDYAVTFHYISENDMFLFEYMLYHLHPYGIHKDYADLVNYLKSNRIL